MAELQSVTGDRGDRGRWPEDWAGIAMALPVQRSRVAVICHGCIC